jgi:curved DNA-binding protein CbpA
MANRRNYYRVLHVQPEAPEEVIKASYRTLMTKLGAHPDRGGDTATAALLNEAYAVLRDPQKRRAYDLSLQQRGTRPGVGQRHGRSPNAAPGRATTTAGPSAPETGPESGKGGGCPFCRAPLTLPQDSSGPCRQCASPLTMVSGQAPQRGEFFGRRRASRVAKNDLLTLYPTWPHAGVGARLRDVSTNGVSLVSALAPTLGQTVKLSGPSIEAIARVVSVRRTGNLYSVHAQLITATFPKRGAFVSARV